MSGPHGLEPLEVADGYACAISAAVVNALRINLHIVDHFAHPHSRHQPRAGDQALPVVEASLIRVGRLGPGVKCLCEFNNFQLAEGMRAKDMKLAHRQIFKPPVPEDTGRSCRRRQRRFACDGRACGHRCHNRAVSVAHFDFESLAAGVGEWGSLHAMRPVRRER